MALDSWGLLVESPGLARLVTSRGRLLSAAWVLGCIHLSQAFRSALTSSLSRTSHEHSPRTLEELVGAVLELGLVLPHFTRASHVLHTCFTRASHQQRTSEKA